MKREQGGKVQRANIQAAKVCFICPFLLYLLRISKHKNKLLFFYMFADILGFHYPLKWRV